MRCLILISIIITTLLFHQLIITYIEDHDGMKNTVIYIGKEIKNTIKHIKEE